MSTDESPRMWRYWSEKKGIEEALQDYYPNTLAADPDLQQALYQIRAARALIQQKMENLPDDEPQ